MGFAECVSTVASGNSDSVSESISSFSIHIGLILTKYESKSCMISLRPNSMLIPIILAGGMGNSYTN